VTSFFSRIQLLKNRTSLKISRVPYGLLKNFIGRKELWDVYQILNRHVRFDLQSGLLSDSDIPPLEGLLVKDTGDEGLRINSQPVELGLMKGCLEDLLVVRGLQQQAGQVLIPKFAACFGFPFSSV
jgi:hypothetical protein